MDRLPGKRFHVAIVVVTTLLFGHFVRDGEAVPGSLLVDANQAPAPHQSTGDKSAVFSASGCARLVGCASAAGDPAIASLHPQPETEVSVASSPAPPSPQTHQPPAQTHQPPAQNNAEGNKINTPSKKSHPGDPAGNPALVQPASQYHYYGGNPEERRRRNVHFYPAPMKRTYADYPRLKRSVRLSPRDMLALLALWERPIALDDTAPLPVLPTQSSRRRYFKHEDIDPELMMDDDDDDENEYGIERNHDPWSEGRESGRRYSSQDPYRSEKRSEQRQRALEEQQSDANKRFQRLVQQQLDELRRNREQPRGRYETANLAGEWGQYLDYKPEYKRRPRLGTARYKPEDVKPYRWLQDQ